MLFSRFPFLLGILSLMAVGLSGCILCPVVEEQPSTHVLPTVSVATKGAKLKNLGRQQILVASPIPLSGVFDTDRVAIKIKDTEIRFLSGVRWADHFPSLLQRSIIRALESTGQIYAIRSHTRLSSDFRLITEIYNFEYRPNQKTCLVNLSVKIAKKNTGEVIRSQQFISEIPVEESSNSSIIHGIGKALREVLTDMTRWVLKSL